ncbi:hypothetical protein [Litorihabitans aurantiacus]|uniref:Uncharacterized protein n=1 Tax=Litorihabitans aurantiacus TaxID=1930061 RepID=A0AA37XEA3_9MICO|nr:hypothetical protein [Litorihabitans aurantiacus]GMA31608.1 hypothetical protein GCM10025875_16000 [Litorihabitans aurantiacus]
MTYQRLRLGGVTVSGTGTDGVEFRVRPNIEGWWGSPTAQHTVTRRAAGHGSWAGLTTLAPRVLVVSGLLLGPEHSLVVAALGRLKSLATRTDTTFEVETPAGSKLATARRDGEVMVTWHSDIAATVSLQLLATDPCIYGALQRTVLKAPSAAGGLEYPLEYDLDYATPLDQQSSASLVNAGDEDSWPVFVAHGPWPGVCRSSRRTGRSSATSRRSTPARRS